MNYKLTIACLILSSFMSCHNNSYFMEGKVRFPDYPSASAIEFHNNHFYIVGDDAPSVLILDSLLQEFGTIPLYDTAIKRIPKPVKPDLEAVTIVDKNKKPCLLAIGSGSLAPYRNTAELIDPVSKEHTTIDLSLFYERLKASGLPELNIEGACSIPGAMVLSNRGHKGFPKNQLILTSANFWEEQAMAPIALLHIGGNEDSSHFRAVSGIAYAKKTDKLILTVSTEDTKNAYDDGTIGKSYLWIVDNFSSKKRWTGMNPNRIINLENADPQFRNQKIESACVIRETKHFIELALVADNDDGSSTLFRLDISKK